MINWLKKHPIMLPWLLLYVIFVAEEMGRLLISGQVSEGEILGYFSLWSAGKLTPYFGGFDLSKTIFITSSALLCLFFCVLLWRLTRHKLPRRVDLLLLIFVLNLSGLPVVVAALLFVLLPLRSACKWLVLQIFIYVGCTYLFYYWGNPSANVAFSTQIAVIVMLVAMHLLGVVLGYLATRERRTRMELEATHAALKNTQARLSASLRTAERQRIAHALHQLMEQHLSALHVHLDLAMRQVDSTMAVHGALHISKNLATDLRARVSSLVESPQTSQRVDLQPALLSLCAGIPKPRIQLNMDTHLSLLCPVLAHTIFCCIQEAITNTVKHAQASVLMLDIARHQQGIRVIIHDDGIGATAQVEGNGLRGMRERVTRQGGQLSLGKHGGTGYGLEIYFPISK